ncbi:putative MltA-interacting MipA family protein precursor [Escherichia coli]|uniref:Putative MltA-interacting MipA family protein n=1 Tax=Escherichia coli TaxID=562 RepID=A0A2X1JCV3_ECOLX|nr:putative MltA-interacting MipA family protein precursor [Escherichia coli]
MLTLPIMTIMPCNSFDKRDSTAMAGGAWYHHERWGTVKASAAADVLDNSNGWVGSYRYSTKCR